MISYFSNSNVTKSLTQKKTSFSPDALKNQDNTNKAILGQNFHDPLHHLDPQYCEVPINSIPQTVKKPLKYCILFGYLFDYLVFDPALTSWYCGSRW